MLIFWIIGIVDTISFYHLTIAFFRLNENIEV